MPTSASSSFSPQLGDVIGSRFVLLSVAGQGGMGTVFRAFDQESQGHVAVKLLLGKEGVERFAHESSLLASLDHPGIVRYLAAGPHGNGRYLAMEWLDGEDLQQRLLRGPLSVGEALALIAAVGDTLGWLHARGLIHRDLKPGNLFLLQGGGVKLIDFGIAREAGARPAVERPRTKAGAIVGTLGYLAPEQARGASDLDARADVFSLGCILYECLVGEPPFMAEGFLALLAKILIEDAPRLRQVLPEAPEALEALLAELLDKEPARRPADGAAVAARLRALSVVPSPQVAAPLAEQARRLLCLLLMRPSEQERALDEEALTTVRAAPEEALDDLGRLSQIASTHGGQLHPLADGSYVIRITEGETAKEHALRGGRCALALRRWMPRASFSLALGASEEGTRALGGLIDRAARSLPSEEGQIALDPATAAFLQERFTLREVQGGARLLDEPAQAPAASAGRRVRFVGRQEELAVLRQLVESMRAQRRAQVGIVVAPPGLGKSRLLEELLRATPHDSLAVLRAAGDPMQQGTPLGLVARLVRSACGISPSAPLPERRAALRQALWRQLLDNAARERAIGFLGELVGVPYEHQSPALEAARRDPSLMADQQRRAFLSWLVARSRARPQLLLVDDLHWADAASLRWIEAACVWMKSEPVAVIAAARPALWEREPALWEALGPLRVVLGPLSLTESSALAGELLGSAASEEQLASVVRSAGGDPFFLEELARATARAHTPRAESVLAALQARVEALPGAARRVLRAASLFGLRCSRAGLAALLPELSRAALAQALDELVASDLLAARDTLPSEEFSFRHPLVQEATYETLTEADRANGHRLAGEWLAAQGEEPILLAEHFARAGEAVRAVHYFRAAAEESRDARVAGEQVLLCAERGEALGASGEDLGALWIASAGVWGSRGQHRSAAERAQEALPLVPVGGELWYRALTQLAISSNNLGRVEPLCWIAEQLLAQGLGPNDGGRQFRAWAVTAGRLYKAEQLALGGQLLARIEEVCGLIVARDPIVATRIYTAQASRASMAGDLGTVLSCNLAVLQAYEQAQDEQRRINHLADLGYVYLELGLIEDAVACFQRAYEAAKDDPDEGHVVATILQNLGLALGYLGRTQEALVAERSSLRKFQRQGNRRMQGGSHIYLAILLTDAGQPEEALIHAEAAADIYREQALRAYALAAYALARLSLGEVAKARAAADEAHQIVTTRPLEAGESMVYLAHIEALAASSDPATEEAIRGAAARLHARAAKISDPSLRESFCQRVPENAAILRWAASLG